MSGYVVFLGGEFVPEAEARISILDHAVLYGDGAFETAAATRGRIFRLGDHIDRLFRSLAALRIIPPYGKTELQDIIVETVRRNGIRDAYVKWLVTRGSNGEPLLDPTGCTPICIVVVRPYLYMVAVHKLESGVRLKTSSLRRPSADVLSPKIKSLNYLNLVLAKIEAQAAGADEALLLAESGKVSEAPGYNIFTVSHGILRTPTDCILEGITRQAVMELATRAGYVCAEASLELYDLYVADEVFLCSTAGGIIPVVEVDGRAIGEGVPGRVTREVRDAYHELLISDPASVPVPGLCDEG